MSIEEVYRAMLEGDRDTVLEKIAAFPKNSPQMMWFEAASTEDEEKRLTLLKKLEREGRGEYSQLATEIVGRELAFEKELSKPPSYQFWKRAEFQGLHGMKPALPSFTIPALILLFTLGMFFLVLWLDSQ